MAAIAILSAALLTGAKATNLPLLLPLASVMIPLVGLLSKRPAALPLISVLAVLISFLPIAVLTSIHTGDWGGDPLNKHGVKLKDPVAGVVGNSLQIGIAAIAPPVFPMSKWWNARTASCLEVEPLGSVRQHFPRFDLSLGELPMEEGAGLGLGITLLLLVSFFVILLQRDWQVGSRLGLAFGLLCWVALGAYMVKLGSESTARLIAAYYPGLLLPLLLVKGQGRWVRRTWWRGFALISQLCILPALILGPARPLISGDVLIHLSDKLHLKPAMAERIRAVYSVYAGRNDQLAIVREHLPLSVKRIGFAGASNESEYSFWKPLGERKVTDLASVSSSIPSTVVGWDCIVASEEGIKERYRVEAKELAQSLGGVIRWEGNVVSLAGKEPEKWYVIESSGRK